jgi:esterase/lipase superfamily enzyme
LPSFAGEGRIHNNFQVSNGDPLVNTRTFEVIWISTEYLVFDAGQPVDALLLLLHSMRPRWIVLRALSDSFFVFSSAELRDLSKIGQTSASVASALGLRKQEASQRCSAKRRVWRSRTVFQQATSKRIVLVNRRGQVTRIGRLAGRATSESTLASSGRSSSKSAGGITKAQRDAARRAFAAPLTRGIRRVRTSRFRSPKTGKRLRNKDFDIVRIFFATDRSHKSPENGDNCSFGNQRCDDGELRLGICHVSIPHGHTTGHLESPSWWRFEFRPDPRKHIVLMSSRLIGAKPFYRRIAQQVTNSRKREAFVFVHGYSVTFADAARRTAQIAHDLKFEGAAILYSWASRGRWRMYPADEATVEWSQHHLEQFLLRVAAKSGASIIHVIAHSMGNRLVLRALNTIGSELRRPKTLLRQIVLAAPDIDAGEFVHLAEAINRRADRITMYASSRDKALRLSRRFHDAPRAGEHGRNILITKGVDTVDASTVDTSFLAHSYFSTKPTVLSDVFYLISQGLPPSQRHGLEERAHERGPYWAFKE